MKIEILSRSVILEGLNPLHGYAAWPTVARLPDGALAMVTSAFRLNHICPFGKCVISYSYDEGKTWTLPAPVIDTLLDDRDGGIAVFGEKNVIVTSFNNTVEFQRKMAERTTVAHCASKHRDYVNAYLDVLERDHDWRADLGSTFRISHDGGYTFGPVGKIPVSCPHGPAALPDGTLLYVGSRVEGDPSYRDGDNVLASYKLYEDGHYEKLGEIENLPDIMFCEPHTIVLPDGTIIVHARVEVDFYLMQSESYDGGRTFTKPHALLPPYGGAPAHLLRDGDTLISTYGYRSAPRGIRAMFSTDGGKSWLTNQVIIDDGIDWDLGYPASVVLKDGSILTVYYAKREADAPNMIQQVIWRYEL